MFGWVKVGDLAAFGVACLFTANGDSANRFVWMLRAQMSASQISWQELKFGKTHDSMLCLKSLSQHREQERYHDPPSSS